MSVFKYNGHKAGRRVSGYVTAAAAGDARTLLRHDKVLLTSLEEMSGAAKAEVRDLAERSPAERRLAEVLVTGPQIEQTLRQLGALLRAGVPILRALRLIADQSPWLLQRALLCAAYHLRCGSSLQHAAETELPFFGHITIGLLAVGEANGTLEQMCAYAAGLLGRRRDIRNQMLMALLYPGLVALMSGGVVVFLVFHVIPKIMAFISDRGGGLPPITLALIEATHLVRLYGLPVCGIAVLAVVAVILGRRSPAVGRPIDAAGLRVPLLGPMWAAASHALWTRTLGLLVRSGIGLPAGLELVSATVGNLRIRHQLADIGALIRQGQPLSTGIRVTGLGTHCPMAEPLVTVGENTGSLDASLTNLAEMNEEIMVRKLKLLSLLIEPTLMLTVGGIVAFVYIAAFMGIMAASQGGVR